MWLAANLVLHGGLLWALRRHVLQQADRLLDRLGDEIEDRAAERQKTEPQTTALAQAFLKRPASETI
jgi:hypothetical protein